jgi:RNA polymerase sigma factor (sigma-70 family)
MTKSRPPFEHLLRELAPQVLSSIVRRYRDFSAAEDAVQEALVAAADHWPSEGIPENPRGWLIHVASRRMVDRVRADAARRHREELVVSLVPMDEQIALSAEDEDSRERDDSLELLFMCCHPALSTASAIALTLRAVGGLTTAEIAKAFLVPEATMAQRISRAKEQIRSSGIPLALPSQEEFSRRLDVVTQVLYLIFNEGYVASSGAELVRVDLSSEALRLTRLLHRGLPDAGEVSGVLSLMLLTDARREARTGASGELIPLDEQDRSLWNRAAIEEGVALLSATLGRAPIGPYQLQAAIAAVHDEADSASTTDWAQILALYGVLDSLADNPLVKLNIAVATAMVEGTDAAFKRLDELANDERLKSTHRIDAVRAHLFERSGDVESAVLHYQRAAAKTGSSAERDYLRLRAARLRDSRAQASVSESKSSTDE